MLYHVSLDLVNLRHTFQKILLSIYGIVCLAACQSQNLQQPLSLEERRVLQNVFQHVMLEEGGVYTLCGNKPMTCFFVAENLKANDVSLTHLSLHDWNIYEKISKRYSINKFLLVKIPHHNVPNVTPFEDGYFVNIKETVAILRKHYSLFREQAGFEFDPLEQISDLANPNSEFWNKVLKNKCLLGILLGYGETNSRYFETWLDASKKKEKIAEQFFSLSTGLSDNPPDETTIQQFPLPIFRTFESKENEQIIKKYRKQKKTIEKTYQGHDFVEMTLEKLTS